MKVLRKPRSRVCEAKQRIKEITISDLYPELTSAEQTEAALHLRQYIDVVCEIYERRVGLTGSDHLGTI